MKVVLFCGGLGTRLREHSDTIPKPLVNIGYRPILWHLMRYYAHFGHKDFILCLGYRGDLIRDYFLNYNECLTNDFVMSEGGQKIEPIKRDIADWRITFVDTGMHANIGQRLLRVKQYVQDEEIFLANYADGLTDMPLNTCIDEFKLEEGDRELHGDAHVAEPALRALGRRRRGRRASARSRRASSGSTPASSACGPRSSTTSRTATSWSRSRSSGSSTRRCCRCIATTASGSRWTRSRKRSSTTAWKRRASARGCSGKKR